MELRHAWTQWFINKGVWKPEFVAEPGPPMAPFNPMPAPGRVDNSGQGQEQDQGQSQAPMMSAGQFGGNPPQAQQTQMPGQEQGYRS